MTRLSPYHHADTALSQPWRSDCWGGQPLPCHARHVTTSSHIVLSIVKRGKGVSSKTVDCIHPMLARGSGRMHEHAASVMWLSSCCSAPELLHFARSLRKQRLGHLKILAPPPGMLSRRSERCDRKLRSSATTHSLVFLFTSNLDYCQQPRCTSNCPRITWSHWPHHPLPLHDSRL